MADKDYILGTHDAEIYRLGLQHRVWRPKMLAAWQRAGIKTGQLVLDIGCGPGFAAIDLAEIVGPAGRVVGVERSQRFLEHLRDLCSPRSISNVEFCEADLDITQLQYSDMDAVWCRWVLSFVQQPERLVTQIAQSLKAGGIAVFHEYLDYSTWRLGPADRSFDAFVAKIMESWRSSGGEPNIGLDLPAMLQAAGMEIVQMQPLIDTITSDNFIWEWPEAFAKINLERLQELGLVDADLAKATLVALEKAKVTKGRFMVTPCVLEVIARKR
jgi:ubiquinone/menaquinone biosynthesis C-methylase UbiE